MSWKPKNLNTATAENQFKYFGTCDVDGQDILVYGEKTAGSPREPQSKRRLNTETFTKMLRGILGVKGDNTLAPLPGSRKSVDIVCFNDPDYENFGDYCDAVDIIEAEGLEVPERLQPVSVEVDADEE
jgi:hypothetical protein